MPADSLPNLSRDELQELLKDPAAAIVDVLPRESYESGHVPGALSLPVAEIKSRAFRLLPDLARPIAVYCGGPE